MAWASNNVVHQTVRTVELKGTMRLTVEDFLDLIERIGRDEIFSSEGQFDFPEVGRRFKTRLSVSFPTEAKVRNLSADFEVVEGVETYVSVSFSLLGKSEKRHLINTHKGIKRSYSAHFPKGIKGSYSAHFPRITYNADVLMNGNLELVCDITFHVTHNTTSNVARAVQPSNRVAVMSNLLKDTTFSDFKISCADKSWPCHKSILAHRSDVLRQMLMSNCWAESRENSLIIEGFSPATVEMMLQFIYTGTIPDPAKITAGLLLIADKYDILGLIDFCKVEPVTYINQKSAIDMLDVAMKLNIKEIKEAAVSVIAQNLDALIDSPNWNKIIEPSREALSAILRSPALDFRLKK